MDSWIISVPDIKKSKTGVIEFSKTNEAITIIFGMRELHIISCVEIFLFFENFHFS